MADYGIRYYHDEKNKWLSVSCTKGHLITGGKTDSSYAGSMFEANLAFNKFTCKECEEVKNADNQR